MEMVERAARAVAENTEMYRWDEYSDGQKDGFRLIARAVIEAMREPTDEMTDAGASEVRAHGRAADRDCEAAWRVMIDSALAGPQSDGDKQ